MAGQPPPRSPLHPTGAGAADPWAGVGPVAVPQLRGSWGANRNAISSGPSLFCVVIKRKDALHLAGEVPAGV